MTIGKNIKRVQNILSGDYTGKSNTQLGYKKETIEYKEGDIWEENGKQWTIKDGIKQTVTKLDGVRKLIRVPMSCPQCSKLLKTKIDKKLWSMRGKCLDCVTEEDTKRIIDGTFEQYEKDIITNNVTSWIKDLEIETKDYISSSNTKSFVTENGQIEDWNKSHTEEELAKIFTDQIDKFKEENTTYIKQDDDNK